jgi:hypothetical protein
LAATLHILLTHNKKKKKGLMINHISVAPTKWRQYSVRQSPMTGALPEIRDPVVRAKGVPTEFHSLNFCKAPVCGL